jgi:hypothetical protein
MTNNWHLTLLVGLTQLDRNHTPIRIMTQIYRIASLAFSLPLISSAWFGIGQYCQAQDTSSSLTSSVELLAVTRISGESSDKSGLDGMLETNTPINAFGGLSAIDYSGTANRYYALSDRGAGDGAASFPCRFHSIDLAYDPASKKLEFSLVGTSMLRDSQSRSLTGSLLQLKGWKDPSRCPSYDPEGIRVIPSANGTPSVMISDEYGPYIDIFSLDGHMLKSIPIPSTFALSERKEPPFQVGTFTNRGLEGIAVTPTSKTIVGAMQGPLVQDGRIENNKCFGIWTRWLVIDPTTSATKQLAYPLVDESTGVSEVLSIDESKFLVLERDSLMGEQAKIKRIYLADTSKATDVSNIESLKSGLPDGNVGIEKSLLIDLLDPRFGFNGPNAPEKPEGIAWGPTLPDGRKLLIVCFDNDFQPTNMTIFAAFAVKL